MLSQQRPGPKRLSISKKPRAFPPKPLKSKARRSFTARKKLQILTYWATRSLPQEWDSESTELRCPTIREVSQYFGGIPIGSISGWRGMEEELLKCAAGDRKRIVEGKSRWPVLETRLYQDFLEKRAEGQIVRRGWFRIRSREHFQQIYPTQEAAEFLFSLGWFTNFLSRHRIAIRFTTNQAQKIPHDYLNLILEFFRFIRRNSQLLPGEIGYAPGSGRFGPPRVVNMDQTPAPFEYLSGRTYAEKGSNTVWAKAEKSGWDKRQATIQLTVLGNGCMLKPWILFKGKGQLPIAETDRYDTRVTVKFNPEGYANEEIILEWIHEQLLPVIQRDSSEFGPISNATGLSTGIAAPNALGLIALDAASFHKTPTIRKVLVDSNVTLCMIPGGCTSLMQVLDVSVNQPFKDFLKEAMEEELYRLVQIEGQEILNRMDQGEDELVDGVISAVGLRRILLTRSVGCAWERFCGEKQKSSIRQCFRKLGLTLPIDGSSDTELAVKGLAPEELIIGNWERDSGEAEEAEEDIEEQEMDDEENNNKDVFFVGLEGATLQVGKLKKKKKDLKNRLSQPPPGLRRQITCSICKQQGHNKRKCPRRAQ